MRVGACLAVEGKVNMAVLRKSAAATAATMMIAQPCLAAQNIHGTSATERQSSAFAGVRLRLPIGARTPERPSVRLQLTTVHDYRNPAGATVRSDRPDGLEFGVGGDNRLTFSVAGQDVGMRQQERRLGSNTTAIVVGGVVVAALALAVLAASQVPPSVDFDD